MHVVEPRLKKETKWTREDKSQMLAGVSRFLSMVNLTLSSLTDMLDSHLCNLYNKLFVLLEDNCV